MPPTSLEDIARLTDRETQSWIREVQTSTLAILLKAEQAPFADKLYRNLSEKVAEFLQADVTAMAAPSLQEVEAAKATLFTAVQLAMTKLEEEIAAERPRFEEALSAAQAGDAAAMFSVADYYEMGIGIRQDREQASHWYDQSAKAGFPGIGGSTRKGILARFAVWFRNLRTSPRLKQTVAKPTELLISLTRFAGRFNQETTRLDLVAQGLWGMKVRIVSDGQWNNVKLHAGDTGVIAWPTNVSLTIFNLAEEVPVKGLEPYPQAAIGVPWAMLEKLEDAPAPP